MEGSQLRDWWQDRVTSTFVPVDFSMTSRDGRFDANLVSHGFGAVQLSEISGYQLDVQRTQATIRRADPGFVKVGVQLHGTGVARQRGREAVLTPGDFVIYDTSEPYVLRLGRSFRIVMLMFDRESLRITPDQLTAVSGLRVPGDQGIGALVSEFLIRLKTSVVADSLAVTPRFEGAVLDLVSAALAARISQDSTTSGAATLLSAKSFIEARLADPKLDTAMVAAAHHVSVRWLQKLFAAEDLTVAGWIKTRRLHFARNDLGNADLAHQPIGVISGRYGLIDSSHFARQFKMAFGLSPRDYRARALGRESSVTDGVSGRTPVHRP
jgi:AraC-like DNA-binding protein